MNESSNTIRDTSDSAEAATDAFVCGVVGTQEGQAPVPARGVEFIKNTAHRSVSGDCGIDAIGGEEQQGPADEALLDFQRNCVSRHGEPKRVPRQI